jgi:hypothetical protein
MYYEFGLGDGKTSLSPLGSLRSDMPREEQERACEFYFGRLSEMFSNGSLTVRDHVQALGIENVKAKYRIDNYLKSPNARPVPPTPPRVQREQEAHSKIDDLAYDAGTYFFFLIQKKVSLQTIKKMVINYEIPGAAECIDEAGEEDLECEGEDPEIGLVDPFPDHLSDDDELSETEAVIDQPSPHGFANADPFVGGDVMTDDEGIVHLMDVLKVDDLVEAISKDEANVDISTIFEGLDPADSSHDLDGKMYAFCRRLQQQVPKHYTELIKPAIEISSSIRAEDFDEEESGHADKTNASRLQRARTRTLAEKPQGALQFHGPEDMPSRNEAFQVVQPHKESCQRNRVALQTS